MATSERFEAFYEQQPPLLFIEELKTPLHQTRPAFFNRETPASGEISAKGIYVVNEFEDSEGLLETAFEDFHRFLAVYGILGDRFPLYIRKEPTACFEAYKTPAVN